MSTQIRQVTGGVVMGVLALAVSLAFSCKGQLAEEPISNQVVHACYHPFFQAAAAKDVDKVKSLLSAETIRYHEEVVFPQGEVLESWKDFVWVYHDMKISQFVSDVKVTGDRAVVVDAVGGTLKCVRQNGDWKVDLTR